MASMTRATAHQDSPGARCCAARGAAALPSSDAGLAQDARLQGMVRIPAGTFQMGSDRHYREERPARLASVEAFWMDEHPVTTAQFARFVAATGYISCAERVPEAACYPDADPSLLVPGSLVFVKTPGPVSLRDFRRWWRYVPQASWHQPEGPGSGTVGREDHPVVHVTYEDALAYAEWAGKALPTEVEWERAARGGLPSADYPWGDEFAPDGQLMANVWVGRFPWESLKPGGAVGTSSVRSFPPNAYGLYDLVGNVWEWTTSRFSDAGGPSEARSCCSPTDDAERNARRVVKGGSHLCAPSYCWRYRPAARQGQAIDTSTTHIGFRCVLRADRRSEA